MLTTPALVDHFRTQRSSMLSSLEAMVNAESPSNDPHAVEACGRTVSGLANELLGMQPCRMDVDGCPHLLWDFGTKRRVVLLGHIDTVWPLGTITRWPFDVSDGVVTGPGVFDMKAGVVQGLFALAALPSLDGVSLLLTGDEELGSPTSRELVERTAQDAEAVLVLEPSEAGALKTQRKGVSKYRLDIEGRAAHAGLEPELGVNALLELARQVRVTAELADPHRGTTVTPTLAAAGTAGNVVPAVAGFELDVRASSTAEQDRIDVALRGLRPWLPGAGLKLSGGPNRPPFEPEASTALYDLARRVGAQLGLPPLRARAVGGGSDGNFTAGIGTPTLDGLGAVGAGAHAEGEYVVIDAMPERSALVTALVYHLLAADPAPRSQPH